jgi:hypothetical protein
MMIRQRFFLAFICAYMATLVHGNEEATNVLGDELLSDEQKNEGTDYYFFVHDGDESDKQSMVSPTERLLAHRQDRKLEFQQRLADIRDQLHDTPGDTRLQRKATAYERKLESLSEELSERQLDHRVAREELFLSEPANRREEEWTTRRGLRGGLSSSIVM